MISDVYRSRASKSHRKAVPSTQCGTLSPSFVFDGCVSSTSADLDAVTAKAVALLWGRGRFPDNPKLGQLPSRVQQGWQRVSIQDDHTKPFALIWVHPCKHVGHAAYHPALTESLLRRSSSARRGVEELWFGQQDSPPSRLTLCASCNWEYESDAGHKGDCKMAISRFRESRAARSQLDAADIAPLTAHSPQRTWCSRAARNQRLVEAMEVRSAVYCWAPGSRLKPVRIKGADSRTKLHPLDQLQTDVSKVVTRFDLFWRK